MVSLIYITLNYLLTFFASWLEARLRRGKKSTGAVVGAGLDGGLETIGPARKTSTMLCAYAPTETSAVSKQQPAILDGA